MTAHCAPCNKSFVSDKALLQHQQDSPKHVSDCFACDRHYNSESALAQHVRDSPVHKLLSIHTNGDQSSSNQQPPAQQRHDSVTQVQGFVCETCNQTFVDGNALQQHLRYSPVHASFRCEPCNKSFRSEGALAQHIRDAAVHLQQAQTPLDLFFRSFPSFMYDPSLPPATLYADLREHEGWRRGDPASSDAWDRYQDALKEELQMWFGAEDDLTAWHALCRAISIEPLPQTCELCQKAARRTHVNIIDLIEWGRQREDNREAVRTFRTVGQLRTYTKKTNKIFRFNDGEDENVVLRHLLRKIFRGMGEG